ncbi:hypothetical protein P7B02_02305 [Caulobacter segnis]|uniref:hypothetical protein n=1 Tax=Caulobacter segnis TaxID=88688 RepID=UPI00240F8E2E|nr:hypothetical protein [Caulobacter segnis]MDG2520359.1 hypothetical protein [Caulobacter segnis]
MERPGFNFTIEQRGRLWTWTARSPYASTESGVARSRRQAAACVIRALVRAETDRMHDAPTRAA